jgi:iron(III) transport system ATP-binding protein
MVGLSAMADRPATNLSGGQQQRVSLARAIIRGAKILLLDEPLSNLDAGLRVEMRRELRELQRLLGVTTLFVTHDQEEAMSMSDRVAIFNQGELVELGKPIDLYLRPAKHFTATFLGLADLIPCKVLETSPADGTALLDTSFGRVLSACPGAGVQDQRSLLIRPEHIVLDAIGGGFQPAVNVYQGVITSVSFGGRYVDYQVRLGDCTLAVQAPSLQVHEAGTRVAVHMPPERCVLLGD